MKYNSTFRNPRNLKCYKKENRCDQFWMRHSSRECHWTIR